MPVRGLAQSCSRHPESFSAHSVPTGPTHTLPMEFSHPNVPCISLASFKFYPFPIFILAFHHLHYIDRILRSLTPPLVCLQLLCCPTRISSYIFTFLATSISDLLINMDKVTPKIIISPRSFRFFSETLRSWKICTRLFLGVFYFFTWIIKNGGLFSFTFEHII